MKKKTVFGTVLLALLVLQAQTVFAQSYNDRQTTNLWGALNTGNVADAKSALQRKADPNSRNFVRWTPLVAAVRKGNLEMVRLLLEYGADPNRTGEDGRFALPEAVENGNLEIVRLLLDKGANVNRRDHIGASPLRSAIDGGNLDMVRLLLDRGANINEGDKYGAPFPTAADKQNLEMLRFLLERGANINARCNNYVGNRTALHHAVNRERMDIVRYLVENGINVNARDSEGRSALNIAFARGEMNIHAYLIANGAMEFEPNQAVAQPAAPAPSSTTNVYVQQPAPAQSAPSEPSRNTGREVADTINNAFQSPLDNGRYRISGRADEIVFAGIAKAGNVSYKDATGTTHRGTYSIDGNRLTINVMGRAFFYNITSKTSFSGNGESWYRTGF